MSANPLAYISYYIYELLLNIIHYKHAKYIQVYKYTFVYTIAILYKANKWCYIVIIQYSVTVWRYEFVFLLLLIFCRKCCIIFVYNSSRSLLVIFCLFNIVVHNIVQFLCWEKNILFFDSFKHIYLNAYFVASPCSITLYI